MKTVRMAGVVAALPLLMLSGMTAHADSAATATAAARYPIDDPDLIDNDLYDTGELARVACTTKTYKRNNLASAKSYLTAGVDCMNRTGQAHFDNAGLPFNKPGFGFITKPRRFCDAPWGEGAAGVYCTTTERFLVLLDRDTLADPSGLDLYFTTAHEYGHHIQNLTGINDADLDLEYENKSELNEQSRRSELQATCLAGVFMGSVWGSQSRTAKDYKELLKLARGSGDEGTDVRSHGKRANVVAWLDRGFKAKSPAACNTWSASSAKVA